MAIEAHHPLTRADYRAEGANAVRVTDGSQTGLFDRQCDPHMCIWLTGLVIVEEKARETAK
jgi:hypothetical protein